MIDMPSRPVLIGSAVSGFFGGLWAVWGSGGLGQPWRAVLTAVGIALGLAVVAGALVYARRAPDGTGDGGGGGGGSMFASRAYRVIVTVEVVAIVVGNVLLGRNGLGDYVIAWTALVVGVHFLAFGRVFDRTFTGIGAAMVVAALAGAVTGLAGGGGDAVLVITGVLSAAVLLGAGGRRVGEALRASRD